MNFNKPDQPKGMQSSQGEKSEREIQGEKGGRENYSFRCADAGFSNCSWETKGATPDEVLKKVEQHGREQHHMTNIDEQTRNKVRSTIHRAA